MSHEKQKAIFNFGYSKYVVDVDMALELFTKLKDVEMMKSDYKDGKSMTFIEPVPESHISVGYISNEEYAVAKMVGKSKQLQREEK